MSYGQRETMGGKVLGWVEAFGPVLLFLNEDIVECFGVVEKDDTLLRCRS